MKKVLFVVLATLIGFVATAQDKETKKANIKFATQEIDYGTILRGSNGERTFKFTNTGDAPLVVSSATSTCGCTIPSFSREPIAPGKTGEIKVKYNTERIGGISKTITVTSNAANEPTVYLRIKGVVKVEEDKK